jgi:cytochrome c5
LERKIRMSQNYKLAVVLGLGTLLAPGVARPQDQSATPPAPANQNKAGAPQKAAQVHNDGERIFAQNCSRCHAAPEGFSPRVSGTIVRHMRVRAQLSQHDEQELLRFFNP